MLAHARRFPGTLQKVHRTVIFKGVSTEQQSNRATERHGVPQNQSTVPIQKNENINPMAALRLSAEYQVLSSFTDGGYTKDKPSPTRHLISRAPQNPLTSSRLALATAALRPPTKINAGAEKDVRQVQKGREETAKTWQPETTRTTKWGISPWKIWI